MNFLQASNYFSAFKYINDYLDKHILDPIGRAIYLLNLYTHSKDEKIKEDTLECLKSTPLNFNPILSSICKIVTDTAVSLDDLGLLLYLFIEPAKQRNINSFFARASELAEKEVDITPISHDGQSYIDMEFAGENQERFFVRLPIKSDIFLQRSLSTSPFAQEVKIQEYQKLGNIITQSDLFSVIKTLFPQAKTFTPILQKCFAAASKEKLLKKLWLEQLLKLSIQDPAMYASKTRLEYCLYETLYEKTPFALQEQGLDILKKILELPGIEAAVIFKAFLKTFQLDGSDSLKIFNVILTSDNLPLLLQENSSFFHSVSKEIRKTQNVTTEELHKYMEWIAFLSKNFHLPEGIKESFFISLLHILLNLHKAEKAIDLFFQKILSKKFQQKLDGDYIALISRFVKTDSKKHKPILSSQNLLALLTNFFADLSNCIDTISDLFNFALRYQFINLEYYDVWTLALEGKDLSTDILREIGKQIYHSLLGKKAYDTEDLKKFATLEEFLQIDVRHLSQIEFERRYMTYSNLEEQTHFLQTYLDIAMSNIDKSSKICVFRVAFDGLKLKDLPCSFESALRISSSFSQFFADYLSKSLRLNSSFEDWKWVCDLVAKSYKHISHNQSQFLKSYVELLINSLVCYFEQDRIHEEIDLLNGLLIASAKIIDCKSTPDTIAKWVTKLIPICKEYGIASLSSVITSAISKNHFKKKDSELELCFNYLTSISQDTPNALEIFLKDSFKEKMILNEKWVTELVNFLPAMTDESFFHFFFLLKKSSPNQIFSKLFQKRLIAEISSCYDKDILESYLPYVKYETLKEEDFYLIFNTMFKFSLDKEIKQKAKQHLKFPTNFEAFFAFTYKYLESEFDPVFFDIAENFPIEIIQQHEDWYVNQLSLAVKSQEKQNKDFALKFFTENFVPEKILVSDDHVLHLFMQLLEKNLEAEPEFFFLLSVLNKMDYLKSIDTQIDKFSFLIDCLISNCSLIKNMQDLTTTWDLIAFLGKRGIKCDLLDFVKYTVTQYKNEPSLPIATALLDSISQHKLGLNGFIDALVSESELGQKHFLGFINFLHSKKMIVSENNMQKIHLLLLRMCPEARFKVIEQNYIPLAWELVNNNPIEPMSVFAFAKNILYPLLEDIFHNSQSIEHYESHINLIFDFYRKLVSSVYESDLFSFLNMVIHLCYSQTISNVNVIFIFLKNILYTGSHIVTNYGILLDFNRMKTFFENASRLYYIIPKSSQIALDDFHFISNLIREKNLENIEFYKEVTFTFLETIFESMYFCLCFWNNLEDYIRCSKIVTIHIAHLIDNMRETIFFEFTNNCIDKLLKKFILEDTPYILFNQTITNSFSQIAALRVFEEGLSADFTPNLLKPIINKLLGSPHIYTHTQAYRLWSLMQKQQKEMSDSVEFEDIFFKIMQKSSELDYSLLSIEDEPMFGILVTSPQKTAQNLLSFVEKNIEDSHAIKMALHQINLLSDYISITNYQSEKIRLLQIYQKARPYFLKIKSIIQQKTPDLDVLKPEISTYLANEELGVLQI